MLRKLLAIFLVLFSVESAYAQPWQWQKECQPGEQTECEVWFNESNFFSTLTASVGNQNLEGTYKSYATLQSPSSAFLFLQTNGLSASQLSGLQSGLRTFVENKKNFQQLALYHSVESGLVPMALLGSNKRQLQNKISALSVQPAPQSVEQNLIDVLKILGGTPTKRKIVFWVTPGADLDASQIQAIKAQLVAEKIRLVIIHLKLSELSLNSASVLQKMAMESAGFFVSLESSAWASKIPALAAYSNNGGIVTLKTKKLCGPQTITFKATAGIGGSALEQTWNGQYQACPPVQPPPAPTVPPKAPTTGTGTNTSQGPATENNGGGNNVPPVVAEPTPPSIPPATPEPTTTPDTGGNPPASPADKPAETASSQTNIFIVLFAGLGIIVLIGAVFMLRKKSAIAAKGNTSYAYLTALGSTSGQRYPIRSSATKLGRSQDNDIVLQDESVSAYHAVIKRERDGRINIIDLNSSNGVKVNGKEVEQMSLNAGDEIELGETRFRFGLEG